MSEKEKPPAIVNSTLANRQIIKLMDKHFKVRVTAATLENTCIFSTAALAFMILEANKLPSPDGNPLLVDNQIISLMDRFSKQLKNTYLIIITGGQMKPSEMRAITQLQHRFIDIEMKIILLPYDIDCVRNMHYLMQRANKSALFNECRKLHLLNDFEKMKILRDILSSIGLNDHDILKICNVP